MSIRYNRRRCSSYRRTLIAMHGACCTAKVETRRQHLAEQRSSLDAFETIFIHHRRRKRQIQCQKQQQHRKSKETQVRKLLFYYFVCFKSDFSAPRLRSFNPTKGFPDR